MLYFVKFKDLTCNFCNFYHFINSLASFYLIWMKFILKFKKIYRTTRLPTRFGPGLVLIGLKTAVFFRSFSNKSEGPGLQSWSFAVLRTGPLSTMNLCMTQTMGIGQHGIQNNILCMQELWVLVQFYTQRQCWICDSDWCWHSSSE